MRPGSVVSFPSAPRFAGHGSSLVPALLGRHRPRPSRSRARAQRVPGQGRALDADRELPHAGEDLQLAQTSVRRCRVLVAGDQVVERLEEPRGTPRRDLPLSASVIIDAEAVEMAQPAPSKLISSIRSPSVLDEDRDPVAAQRIVTVGAVRSRPRVRPKLRGFLPWSRMTLLVQIAQFRHQPSTSIARWMPATRASTSSRVL